VESSSSVLSKATLPVAIRSMICGWYQATNRPSLVGGPAGKGVGRGVGVAVGWSVADGGGSVANGESNGDWNTPAGVAVAVGDAVAVAVGDGLAVALGSTGWLIRPGEGEGAGSSVDKPQPDRIAANVAAPAPLRKRRRLKENCVPDIASIVTANPAPVNHASATVRLHPPYGPVQASTDTSSR
jgi:hypothetical protein